MHIILPEIMKKNGYTTGMFGKWAGGCSTSTPRQTGRGRILRLHASFRRTSANFLNSTVIAAGDTAVSRV